MPSAHRDSYRLDPRRFLVTTERLTIYSGVYGQGEIITDSQAGSARDSLLAMGMLLETGYDLAGLSTLANSSGGSQ